MQYCWNNNGVWEDKQAAVAIASGQVVPIFVAVSDVSKITQIGAITLGGSGTINLNDILNKIPNLKILNFAFFVVQGWEALGSNPCFLGITALGFIFSDLSGIPDFSPIELLVSLEIINFSNSDFNARFDIGKLINLNIINFDGCTLSQLNLDYYCQTLYEAGASFTGVGKILNIDSQSFGTRASGNIGDDVNLGTGQGFISGLIDQYGWTVIQ